MNSSLEKNNYTNSEAISYYLLWNANSHDKTEFDRGYEFIKDKMENKDKKYLMWKLDDQDNVIDDGGNIASDADLRVIGALIQAHERWEDERYLQLADELAEGLEDIAITPDGYFAPYGGVNEKGEFWKTNEVWLSYADFGIFSKLSERRGTPWNKVYFKMREATIDSQLSNGLYDSKLTTGRKFENLDGDKYGVNTLWIMVRAAESNDPILQDSARKSLKFYKEKWREDRIIYATYDRDGIPNSDGDSPWVYALVGRAAISLHDKNFADEMIHKLLEFQVLDENSALYGAFPEGDRAGQFTNQETIITLQKYVGM